MSTPYQPYDEYDQPGAGERQEGQGIRDLREHLKEVSEQLKAMKAENDRLQDAQRQTRVADTLRAKGFAPEAASLYAGEPDKLDDWLGTHGAALARLNSPAPEGGQEQPQVPAGPPQSTVPAQDQQAIQALQDAGAQAAPPEGSDKEMAAELAAIKTPKEFQEYMQRHGNNQQFYS